MDYVWERIVDWGQATPDMPFLVLAILTALAFVGIVVYFMERNGNLQHVSQ